jgi:hypothetical protein
LFAKTTVAGSAAAAPQSTSNDTHAKVRFMH